MKDTDQMTEAKKQFEASVSDLYDAWVNPEKLKQWWHPAENKLVNVENDVTQGGNIKYEFETNDGSKAFVITGTYKEVKPEEKLVYTWNWQMPENDAVKDNHFELTVEFSGVDNGSTIRVSQTNTDDTETIHPHQKGWEENLENLHRFLNK